MNKFKDVVIDVSDACTIQVDALELISQLKDHFAYYNLTGFFVDCHLKYNLENFDDPIKYNYDERVCGGLGAVDDVESHAELAREAIDKYNHHKGAKLKLVRMIKMNVMFTFLIRYCFG
ncbi:uncharacterized protein LOC110701504 [Chenopodium quinoa]|uniref:uncharacterized protein LOC110701504 n=1 Tax=Chenopodium quinoa TaxID=63459 RepID=UPI000B77B4A8|nr:uncharacterized protein LOC110701504 [Chenopodium quinoa]